MTVSSIFGAPAQHELQVDKSGSSTFRRGRMRFLGREKEVTLHDLKNRTTSSARMFVELPELRKRHASLLDRDIKRLNKGIERCGQQAGKNPFETAALERAGDLRSVFKMLDGSRSPMPGESPLAARRNEVASINVLLRKYTTLLLEQKKEMAFARDSGFVPKEIVAQVAQLTAMIDVCITARAEVSRAIKDLGGKTSISAEPGLRALARRIVDLDPMNATSFGDLNASLPIWRRLSVPSATRAKVSSGEAEVSAAPASEASDEEEPSASFDELLQSLPVPSKLYLKVIALFVDLGNRSVRFARGLNDVQRDPYILVQGSISAVSYVLGSPQRIGKGLKAVKRYYKAHVTLGVTSGGKGDIMRDYKAISENAKAEELTLWRELSERPQATARKRPASVLAETAGLIREDMLANLKQLRDLYSEVPVTGAKASSKGNGVLATVRRNRRFALDKIDQDINEVLDWFLANQNRDFFLPKGRFSATFSRLTQQEDYTVIIAKIIHDQVLLNRLSDCTAGDEVSVGERVKKVFLGSNISTIRKYGFHSYSQFGNFLKTLDFNQFGLSKKGHRLQNVLSDVAKIKAERISRYNTKLILELEEGEVFRLAAGWERGFAPGYYLTMPGAHILGASVSVSVDESYIYSMSFRKQNGIIMLNLDRNGAGGVGAGGTGWFGGKIGRAKKRWSVLGLLGLRLRLVRRAQDSVAIALGKPDEQGVADLLSDLFAGKVTNPLSLLDRGVDKLSHVASNELSVPIKLGGEVDYLLGDASPRDPRDVRHQAMGNLPCATGELTIVGRKSKVSVTFDKNSGKMTRSQERSTEWCSRADGNIFIGLFVRERYLFGKEDAVAHGPASSGYLGLTAGHEGVTQGYVKRWFSGGPVEEPVRWRESQAGEAAEGGQTLKFRRTSKIKSCPHFHHLRNNLLGDDRRAFDRAIDDALCYTKLDTRDKIIGLVNAAGLAHRYCDIQAFINPGDRKEFRERLSLDGDWLGKTEVQRLLDDNSLWPERGGPNTEIVIETAGRANANPNDYITSNFKPTKIAVTDTREVRTDFIVPVPWVKFSSSAAASLSKTTTWEIGGKP